MSGNIDKIDQEELDRIEDELLEEEAKREEEKMRVEGKSVFEIERMKRKRREYLRGKDGKEDRDNKEDERR